MKHKYILLLGFITLFTNSIIAQTVNTVTDSIYDGSTLVYTLSATTTATATKVDVSVTIAAETGYDIANITSIALHSDTDGTLSGRSTLGNMTAGGSGVYTYEHVVATDSPLFYSLKVNSTDGGGLSISSKRTYAAIYLPNAPTETITHSFTDTDLVTKVHPSTTDNTVVLEIEISDDDYFYEVLDGTGVSPYYPAGSKPLFIQDVLADSDDNPSGRADIGNANIYWGAKGVTYAKLTIPLEKIDDQTGYTYLWYKNGRPGFDSNTVGVGIPVYLESAHATLGTDEVTTDHIALYPNPASTQVSVKAAQEIQAVQLLELTGRTVLSKLANGEKAVVLDVSGQASGIYMVRVQLANKVLLKKLILN